MAPRGGIVLSRMENGSKRRTALRKRTKGLINKVHHLSVLCGAEAAMVIYEPEKNEPIVYPEEEKAKATILKYASKNWRERMAHSQTAKKFFEQKRQKKMAKAKKWNDKVENLSGEVILTMITDGELTFEEINSEQKKMVAKFLATLKAQVVHEIQKKGKEGNNSVGLNKVIPQAPFLAGPVAGGAQSAMRRSGFSRPVPEQMTALKQKALQGGAAALVPNQKAFPSLVIAQMNKARHGMDIAGGDVIRNSTTPLTIDKQMPPVPFSIAPLVPPISLGDGRNGNLREMNRQTFTPLPRRPFWQQSHQSDNTPWMPQMRQSFPRPARNQLPPQELGPASAQFPLLPPQLRPASADQFPPLPPQLRPAPAQLPPLPPQLEFQLPPNQLELASQLLSLPHEADLMSLDLFRAQLRGQLPPHPDHQLAPRSLELFPQPSQLLQIRGSTNMRLDAPTLEGGFEPYHGAVNHTNDVKNGAMQWKFNK